MATVTPATRITEPVCNAFQLYFQSQILNGAVVLNPTAVLAYQNLDIVGDANGAPELILNTGTPGWNENLSGDAQLLTALGEEVTRADGTTKMTVGDLLQAILQSRAVTLSVALAAEQVAAVAAAAAQASAPPLTPN